MSITPLLPAPSANLQLLKNSGKPVRVLTIDGGALRGIVPATILAFLDGTAGSAAFPVSTYADNQVDGVTIPSAQNGASITDCFDLIVGTSAGGLITAGVAVPALNQGSLNGADLVNMFYDNGATIFPPPNSDLPDVTLTAPGVATLSEPMFDNAGLLQSICGTTGDNNPYWGCPPYLSSPTAPANLITTDVATLSQIVTNLSVLITSFNNGPSPTSPPNPNAIDATTPHGPVFINEETVDFEGNSISVAQACLMTSAFPMLLPPVPDDLSFQQYGSPAPKTTTTRNYFLDGGVWAGNPALATYMWLISNGFEIDFMISLGCGAAPDIITPTTDGAPYEDAAAYGSGLGYVLGLPKTNPGWLGTATSSVTAPYPWVSPVTHKTTSDSYEVKYPILGSELMSVLGQGAADWSLAFLNSVITSAGGTFVRINPPLGTSVPPYASSSTGALQPWIAAAATALTENGQTVSPAWTTAISAINAGLTARATEAQGFQ